MDLTILTWNINFIHDSWNERVFYINKIIEKEVESCDLIALQEATLPFSDAVTDIYKFLKNTNIKYFDSSLLERNYFYRFIHENFPKYKKYIEKTMEYLMNTLLFCCCWVYSKFGEHMKYLYFNHPYICLCICVLCPIIFAGTWFFFGMITILNKKINSVVKSKLIGNRMIQYNKFIYNSKNIIFVNIHLSPGENKQDKRLKEIKEIVNFCSEEDIIILAGDFNDTPDSNVATYLKNNDFKSCVSEFAGEDLCTFPSNNPIKCIDFVWVKGKNVEVKNALIFGSHKATDHKGIKVQLEIK